MRIIFLMLMIGLGGEASGTTYYVSSSSGSDSNSGTSSANAWKTIGKVNGATFAAGDSILLKRGDVWNESLVPPSPGASGNPITFDAYGTGAAPNLTGYYAVLGPWINVTGNVWKAAVPSSYTAIDFCLFGSVWGQKVPFGTGNLTAKWDFYLSGTYVYVYSVGNPSTYYPGAIVPMALSNVPVINVNGKSWLTFQHLLVNWFDDYGVYVQGTSDHLVFANMEADSMIPQGTQPLGFYVNESAPGPGDIKIYNVEAHMNYDGFRFDGAAIAITMVNDKGYANRDGALVDNTGAVTYSYCHFYASSLAVAGSTDVLATVGTGAIAGAGNIAADTAPAVQAWQRYPARVTLTVDDIGMTPGADAYYGSTVLPIANAAAVPVGVAITVGYTSTITPIISEIQGWINAAPSVDVTSHSMSHTYYTNTDALDIQYTGSGTAATLAISGQVLTITVTGAADGVSYNLAQGATGAQDTITKLKTALTGTGKFTATENPVCQGPYGTGCSLYTGDALLTQDLADVSSQNVKSAVYAMQLDVTRLTTDEITLSRSWMTTHLTGLPATPVYVYPGGYEDPNMEAIAAGVPYVGGRGALHEGGTSNLGAPITGVKDTYATGFNVQDITSFGVNPSWMGLTPTSLQQKVQAMVWKEKVWGVPWGIFWHYNAAISSGELSATEVTNLIADLQAAGATVQKNTDLVNWLLTGTLESGNDGNFYYKSPATSMPLDFRPTAGSPVVDAGENLGTAYQIDISGLNQNNFGTGWEIGAHAFAAYSSYGQTGGSSSYFLIGTSSASLPAMAPQLPTTWVNNNEGNSGFAYELILGASSWTTGPPPTCSFSLPYAVSATGLQSAINAIEACRTLTGVGIALDIPPGLYSSSAGIIIPQSNSALSPNFLVLRSTLDSSLPNGRTVCSHGIQDNLATSTDPGIDNPDCAGDALTYQLGTTVTNVPAGPFTLGNGTSTNSSAYNDVQYMWTVETSGVNKTAFQTCSPLGASGTSIPPLCAATTIAPDHWLIEDMEARMSVGNTSNDIIVAVQENSNETSLSQLPTHIHFRKVWVHGDWTSLGTGANSVSGDFRLSCVYCSLVDSQVSQSLRPGGEGHAIGAGWGSQFKVDHNWVEGSSSGYFSGGFTGAPSIAGLVPSTDVELRRNRFTFPYSWLGVVNSTCGTHGTGTIPPTNPTYGCTTSSGFSLVRKNSTEFKEGIRVLEAGNIFENVDGSGGQGGVLNNFNVRNNSGVTYATGNNYQAVISDVTAQNNIRRNSCEGFGLDSSNATLGDGGGVSFLLARASFSNELIYNVSNTNPGCVGVNSTGLLIASETLQWQGTVTENSAGTQAVFVANCSADLGGCPGQVASLAIGSVGTGCVNGNLIFSTPSTTTGTTAAGKYTCSGGALSTLTLTVPGSGYVSSAATATLTTGTGTVTVTMNSGATAPTTGFEYMDMNPGDPVSISGCTAVTAFNAPTHVVASFTVPVGVGPLAAAGTVPASLTVAYPWTTTGSTSDSSGNCTLTKGEGGPTNLLFEHVTFITDATHSISSGNIPSNGGPNFAINSNFANSIVLGGGWFNNSIGEGTLTEKWNHDYTSMTADHLVWPTRTSSAYTVYCNNVLFPCGSPLMFFPTTAYCSGASATSACVGFNGAMSSASMPLVLSDYHQFALIAGSVFKSGGSEQASDGTDIGVNISALDAAQTQNLYGCSTACGSSGPFPDVPGLGVLFGFAETTASTPAAITGSSAAVGIKPVVLSH